MTKENSASAGAPASAALAPDADLLDRLRRYRQRLAEQDRDFSLCRLDAAIAGLTAEKTAACAEPPRIRRGLPRRDAGKPE